MGISVRNTKVTSRYDDHSYPPDSHEGSGENYEGLEGEKEEKRLGENGRSKEGKTADKEEGRKGKQRLIMRPPRFQTSGSQSGGPQAK